MSDELKPCPFCGDAARISSDSEHSTAFILYHHSRGCPVDDLWDWYPDRQQAITAWNTRTPAPDLLEAARLGLEAWQHIAAGNYPDDPDFAAQAQQKADLIKAVLEKVEG